MSGLRIKIKLNKGGRGILLQHLADVAKEAQKFLEQFGSDVHLEEGQWVAENFKNGSLSFDLINPLENTPEPVIHQAYEALKHITDVKTNPDNLGFGLRQSTLFQYAKMAIPLDADEAVELGLYNGSKRPKVRKLTKLRAVTIQKQIVRPLRHYGAIQGKITAFFSGSCGLWVHDLLANQRVVCNFQQDQYDKIAKLLRDRDAIVQVEGWFTTNQLGEQTAMVIETIDKCPEYREGDLEKFFGSDPDFTGGLTTEEYIDKIRTW
jgi:hypothetical protein